MSDKESSSVTLSKDTFYGIIIVALAGMLVLSILTQGFGIIKTPSVPSQPSAPAQPSAPSQPTQPSAPTQPTQPTAPGSLKVAFGDYTQLGAANATVAWVEFSDFQCPFCGKIYTEAEAQIRTNYINTGKVKLYFRDYPLPFHPNAMPGANAARCADEQGKFWAMHDKLFSTQSEWSSLSDPGSVFKGYAADIGLNNTTFSTCYDQKKYQAKIQADETVGSSYGVQGTPSNFLVIQKSKATLSDIQSAVTALNTKYGQGIELFVNDDSYVVLIPGAYPYDAFDTVLSKVSY